MRYLIPLLLITLLLTGASSCTGGPGRYEEVNYFEGPDGLTMELVENSPPERVYSEYTVPVTLKIENAGAWDIIEDFSAQASLSYDGLYFAEDVSMLAIVEEQRTDIQMYGKSPYWPTGQNQFFTIAFLKANALSPREGVETEFIIGLCYPYQTTLAASVCVDADPSRLDSRPQPCYAENMVYANQGAPVAITEVLFESLPAGTQELELVGPQPVTDDQGNFLGTEPGSTTEFVPLVRPVFRMTLTNVGGGSIVRARNFDEQQLCEQQAEQYPPRSVLVRGWLGNTALTCVPSTDETPEGVALGRMIDDKIEVMCMVPDDALLAVRANYNDILRVEVAYTYRLMETVDVEIIDTMAQFQEKSPISIECKELHRNQALCLAYAGTHNCAWCNEEKTCLTKDACNNCGDYKRFDDRSRECVKDCPLTPPTLGITRPKGTNYIELTCTDATQDGKPVDNWRCGCDRSKIYYAFVRNATDPCPEYGNYENDIAGVFDNNRKTVSRKYLEDVEDGMEKVCGYAEDINGQRSAIRQLRIT